MEEKRSLETRQVLLLDSHFLGRGRGKLARTIREIMTAINTWFNIKINIWAS